MLFGGAAFTGGTPRGDALAFAGVLAALVVTLAVPSAAAAAAVAAKASAAAAAVAALDGDGDAANAGACSAGPLAVASSFATSALVGPSLLLAVVLLLGLGLTAAAAGAAAASLLALFAAFAAADEGRAMPEREGVLGRAAPAGAGEAAPAPPGPPVAAAAVAAPTFVGEGATDSQGCGRGDRKVPEKLVRVLAEAPGVELAAAAATPLGAVAAPPADVGMLLVLARTALRGAEEGRELLPSVPVPAVGMLLVEARTAFRGADEGRELGRELVLPAMGVVAATAAIPAAGEAVRGRRWAEEGRELGRPARKGDCCSVGAGDVGLPSSVLPCSDTRCLYCSCGACKFGGRGGEGAGARAQAWCHAEDVNDASRPCRHPCPTSLPPTPTRAHLPPLAAPRPPPSYHPTFPPRHTPTSPARPPPTPNPHTRHTRPSHLELMRHRQLPLQTRDALLQPHNLARHEAHLLQVPSHVHRALVART